jgi:hypothetical protein
MKRSSGAAIILTLLVFAARCLAQPSSAAKSTTITGAITGRVVNSAGEPLAGASINAGRVSSNFFRKTVSTDSKGEFKIDGLEPALYSVFASMPGYVTVSRSTDSPNFYRLGDSVTLTMSKGGVITGTDMGRDGPLVGVGVFAARVRDADGKKLPASYPGGNERRTDDRGIFRMYGLPPGAYIIMATKPRLGTILPSAYDFDVPTFYPSGTRDTAAEIVVREGDEITADINYRAESGHAISGKFSGIITDNQRPFGSNANVSITDLRDRTQIANGASLLSDNTTFAIYGVPDGDYELTATQYVTNETLRSLPQRVTVRGGDVTGLNLKLEPLASISGRLTFKNDPAAACGKRKETAVPETLVFARTVEPSRKSQGKDDQSPTSAWPAFGGGSAPADAKGSFTVRSLVPGAYRIDPRLPASGWYVQSIAFAPATATKANGTATKDAISVRVGEHLSGVMVTIVEGGAGLRGKLSVVESQTPSSRQRVYLVPMEREAADNVYRFFEAPVGSDGSFTLDNVAPGKYLIGSRPAEENELGIVKAVRQDEALRAKVREEAQARNQPVTLKPCEQVGDFSLQALSAPR